MQQMISERIQVVDALRGIALFAILIANVPVLVDALPSGSIDFYADAFFRILIDKKFITLFSILFGFGFYKQMEKASASLINVRKYFIIRMILLFIIGSVHGYVLWFGDIIKAFALGGIFLLFLYRLPLKKLFWTAIGFNVFLTGIMFIGNDALGWQQYNYDYSLSEKLPMVETYSEYLKINYIINPWTNFFKDLPITLFFTFGNMIIGVLFARIHFFTSAQKRNQTIFITTGLFFGVTASYIYYLLNKGSIEISIGLIWVPFLLVAGMVLQSLAYISLFVRFYRTKLGKVMLSPFLPVGKMALTNYLVQSVFYIGIFYHFSCGLRLYGELSLVGTYITCVFLFVIQLVISRIWLRFFNQGPVEFIWKYFAYKFFKPGKQRIDVTSISSIHTT